MDTSWYMPNISYIVSKQWEGPMPAYCSPNWQQQRLHCHQVRSGTVDTINKPEILDLPDLSHPKRVARLLISHTPKKAVQPKSSNCDCEWILGTLTRLWMDPGLNDRIVNGPWTQWQDCEWTLDRMTELWMNPRHNDRIVIDIALAWLTACHCEIGRASCRERV